MRGTNKMRYNTKELLTVCKQASKVLPRSPLNPILACLKLDGYGVQATDLETSLNIKLAELPTSQVVEDEIFILPAKRLVEILSHITSLFVDIRHGNDKPSMADIVDTNDNVFSIDNLDHTDYPVTEFHPDIPGIEIEGLGQHLTNINKFCDQYDTGSVVGGISIKDGALCATDGNRLSCIELAEVYKLEAIIPSLAIKQLSGLLDSSSTLDIRVSEDTRSLKIIGKNWYAIIRLISGQYPLFKKLFPTKTKQSITIKRLELLKAIKVLKPSKTDKKPIIKFEGNKVTNSTDTITINQDMPLFGVNPNFLIEALEAFTSDEITLGYSGPLQPLIFTDKTTHKHLLMPIDIKEFNKVTA